MTIDQLLLVAPGAPLKPQVRRFEDTLSIFTVLRAEFGEISLAHTPGPEKFRKEHVGHSGTNSHS